MDTVRHRIAVIGITCILVAGVASVGWASNWKTPLFPEQSGSTNPFVVFIVNQDQFAGSWKQFKGELKEEWGEFTDDDLLQIEGKMDKFEGKMQERYGERKEELREWTNKWFERHTFESQSSRSNP